MDTKHAWAVAVNGKPKAKQDWSADCDDASSSEFLQVIDKSGNAVALVVATGWASGVPNDLKARAALIAAAPDLLAALQEQLAEAAAYEEDGSRFDKERNDRARAAIARATGAA